MRQPASNRNGSEAGGRLVHCLEGHELQAVVDPRAREIAAGEMDQVEGPLVAEAPDRVQGRGLDRTR
jgi:hypothetical protein